MESMVRDPSVDSKNVKIGFQKGLQSVCKVSDSMYQNMETRSPGVAKIGLEKLGST